MLIIGSHVSFTKEKQLLGSVLEALSYNANTFMFYTGAPQNTNRYKIDDENTKKAHELMDSEGIDSEKVIVHAPYIVNLANRTDEDKYQFSIHFLKDEVRRCNQLGIKYMVMHPGSHVGTGIERGITNIVDGLNHILEEDNSVTVLLETMAGKGSEVGVNFEEIRKIIDGIYQKDKIGVCLDTCHLSDSGYDITNFDQLLLEFDSLIGLSYIKCIHINDSKNVCGAKKDRHENIGYGHLGFDNLIKIIYHEKLENVPKILETPWIGDNPPYKEEIEMIRCRKFGNNLNRNND